ncbi:MAG: hypothetical protein KDA91_12435 [Planctomycetaceae bacterium]|nr:hypothetical protein [Planctomycetaceae bacterium]
METAEQFRLQTQANAAFEQSPKEFGCYDGVDCDSLIAVLTVVRSGDSLKAIRDIRKVVDIPLTRVKQALMDCSELHRVDLAECAGLTERHRAMVILERMKKAIAMNSGAASINLSSPDGDFRRTDCSDSELNYLRMKLISWM